MARKQVFKRRPNNAGTVVKLSGKRRKPYCAKITDGYDIITGRQIQKSIGCFATWQEADDALTLYRLTNKKVISDQEAGAIAPNVYQQIIEQREKNMPTFKEIFDIIYEDSLSKLSKSAATGYRSWIKHFKKIYDVKITQITLADLQELFDCDVSGNGTKVHMKVLAAKIFEYAVIHQYIKRDDNYTEYIKCGKAIESTKHFAFTNEEIKTLINDNNDYSKIILIYIFTGLRANELLNISRKNIHLDEEFPYLVAGSKTDAGKNRVVPIHKFIEPFIKEIALAEGRRKIDYGYTYFRPNRFVKLMNRLNMDHTLHDTRDTFATLCQQYNVDLFARKRILGHKMNDITFDTYTTTVIETLYKEINKIKAPQP